MSLFGIDHRSFQRQERARWLVPHGQKEIFRKIALPNQLQPVNTGKRIVPFNFMEFFKFIPLGYLKGMSTRKVKMVLTVPLFIFSSVLKHPSIIQSCWTVFYEIFKSSFSLAISSFSVKSDEEAEDVIHQFVSTQNVELSVQIQFLKEKIAFFDDFIRKHPDLMEMCLEYLRKYPEAIAIPRKVPLQDLDPENEIDYMTLQKIEKNHLEHLLNERLLFIRRYPEVFQLFTKYVLESVK